MTRVTLGLTIAALILAAGLPAAAQTRAAGVAPGGGGDDRTWTLTIAVRPDLARRTADSIVRFVKDPSSAPRPSLSDVLGIFSASVATVTPAASSDRSGPQTVAGRLAASACTAAVGKIEQHAGVLRDGYDALASGLPDGKVTELRQKAHAAAGQLATAARSAIDQARKATATRQKQ